MKSPTKESHSVRMELWSYATAIGTAWVDSLDEIDDDIAECARDDGGKWGPLDVDELDGDVEVDGEFVNVDFAKVEKKLRRCENNWDEFRDKIGIYSVDIDKAGCTVEFTIDGEFDLAKLKIFYTTAIGTGYYSNPENNPIRLLNSIEYDGKILEFEGDDDRDNKGCMFTVFNKGKFAEYRHGCDVNKLEWKPFPDECWPFDINFRDWKNWDDKRWERIEKLLSVEDTDEKGLVIIDGIHEDMEDALDFYCNYEEADMSEEEFLKGFFTKALARSIVWLDALPNDYYKMHLLECGISPDEYPGLRDFIISWCNDGDENNGYYEDDDNCMDFECGYINRWAYVLTLAPQLACACTTYQKFNGYSQCMLLAAQPQFADKFSLEELGDPKAACWCGDSESYSQGWDSLVDAQLKFAKYCKN